MNYQLDITTDRDQGVIRLNLRDPHGTHCGHNLVTLHDLRPSDWEALFDLRRYVARYRGTQILPGQAEPATALQLLDHLGALLGQRILGPEIFGKLAASDQRRTLLVHLPTVSEDPLAAAFARVPWEIARSAPGEKPLMERSLVVRSITERTTARDDNVAVAAEAVTAGQSPLRVLVVFAETPGSRPLAMRRERQDLLDLFERAILPDRNIVIDTLCHGVTRTLLRQQITRAQGYHVVHWSGHGRHNRLELLGDDGQRELIQGEELVELFRDAGGFIPQLVFLSACLSGAFVDIRSWAQLRAAMHREARSNEGAAGDPGQADNAASGLEAGATRDRAGLLAGDSDRPLDDILEQPDGYTGTALELLRCGVPQVVAMRYSVGDSYARELALAFYRHLFTDADEPGTDSALALARSDLARGRSPGRPGQRSPDPRFSPVDHANPLMFGQAGSIPTPSDEESDQLDRWHPRPLPLLAGKRDLDARRLFVGRSRELTRLHREWLPTPSARDHGPGVAVIQGLGGLGKTCIASELIHLWHPAFRWVLAFQARPHAIDPDAFYRHIDVQLAQHSTAYSTRCKKRPGERVYLETGGDLGGSERHDRMRSNLLIALRREAILLVIDNFETHLERIERADGSGHGCKNPEWDRLLAALAENLMDSRFRSRLLITSRLRPAALAGPGDGSPEGEACLWLPLGPLPTGEAMLFLRNHRKLSELLHGDKEDRRLLERLLRISRGHPLILDRLGALADDREALGRALGRLEGEGMAVLPDLFAGDRSAAEQEREHAYLQDVAVGSVDVLIEGLGPDSRRLLWVLTQADEPVETAMLEGVWSEESPTPPPMAPLLAALHRTGLVTEEVPAGRDGPVSHGFHELVRERIAAWMAENPGECAGRTAEAVRVAYGERYAALFKQLLGSGRAGSRTAAAEAGRRGVVYLVRARAFDRLGSLASRLVTGTKDPTLLAGVIAELEAVADQVPAGRSRWALRVNLADALRRSGRPDLALALYEQAASEAEQAGNWSDVGVTCGNWASALHNAGQLDASRAMQLRSAEVRTRAGEPGVDVVGSELEALRIDVMQGKAREALPSIATLLDPVRTWWQAHRAGQSVPEAPDSDVLGRVLIAGLDIAVQANLALEQWAACLALLEEIEQVQRDRGESRHEMARTRFNQYGPLLKLGRLDQAQAVIEDCLDVYREAGYLAEQARALSALAHLWKERNDLDQAIGLERQALTLRNRLPDPAGRAISHNNLSSNLDQAGQLEDMARHSLAAITYRLVIGHHQDLSTSLRNLTLDMRRAARAGETYHLPRLADLLAVPEFHALGQFLADRAIDLPALQQDIDQFAAQARQAAEQPA